MLLRPLLALILPLLICLPAHAMENLVISAGGPCNHASGESTDFFKDLFREIGRRTNLDITVVHLPERRAADMAVHGMSDGIAPRPAGFEKHFPHLVRVREPLIISRFVAFTRTGDCIASWRDLAGRLAALPRDWTLPTPSLPASTRLTEVSATHHGMAMLDAGRVDAALTVLEMGLHEIGKHGFSHIDRHPPTLAEQSLYLYLHERRADLAPVIDAALREIKADGAWDRIYRQTVEDLDAGTE